MNRDYIKYYLVFGGALLCALASVLPFIFNITGWGLVLSGFIVAWHEEERK